MVKKIILLVIFAIISVIIISNLGGYLLFNNLKTEKGIVEEVEIKENLKELRFYTNRNVVEFLDIEKADALVSEYFQGDGTSKEGGLIGRTDREIREIIEISPLYEKSYEEYFNGEIKSLEKPNILWGYTLYDKDDSGIYLLFKWSEEKSSNVVVDAYINTLSGDNYLELYEVGN